jgi:nucleoside 2-deoxyribosyltransferase
MLKKSGKFYLAGGFYGSWKDRLRDECVGLKSYDPERDSGQQAIYGFVSDDLDAIDPRDGVIARWDTYPHLEGLMAEIGYAVAKDKPVLLILDGVTVPNPFVLGLAKRVFVGMDAFIAWWNARGEIL